MSNEINGHRSSARVCARVAMSSTASQMSDEHQRGGNTVRYADLRTSMNDLRASLCIAIGVPPEHIDRNGYDLSTPEAGEYMAAQRREIEARRAGAA